MTYTGTRATMLPVNLDADLTDAACLPWTGSHDSRHRTESDRQFQARYTIAKAICDTCPARTDCIAEIKHYRAHRAPLDGIFAGHHFRYGGDTQ